MHYLLLHAAKTLGLTCCEMVREDASLKKFLFDDIPSSNFVVSQHCLVLFRRLNWSWGSVIPCVSILSFVFDAAIQIQPPALETQTLNA